MQTAADGHQPLEQALSETQAECRTLERLDEAIEMLKRAPGIEEVDQRLAFSDAKLAAALARLDAATLAASKTASPPPETASPPPEGAAPSGLDAKRLERLEQAIADLSRDVAAATPPGTAARRSGVGVLVSPLPRDHHHHRCRTRRRHARAGELSGRSSTSPRL